MFLLPYYNQPNINSYMITKRLIIIKGILRRVCMEYISDTSFALIESGAMLLEAEFAYGYELCCCMICDCDLLLPNPILLRNLSSFNIATALMKNSDT